MDLDALPNDLESGTLGALVALESTKTGRRARFEIVELSFSSGLILALPKARLA